MYPIITAPNDATRTAPAAVSLAIFARGLKPGDTRSTTVSMAVLSSSVTSTKETDNASKANSIGCTLKKSAANNTKIAAAK